MFPGDEGEEDGEEDGEEGEVKLECRVMLQKEMPEGLKDEECGKQVAEGQAGLCQYVGRGGHIMLVNGKGLSYVLWLASIYVISPFNRS